MHEAFFVQPRSLGTARNFRTLVSRCNLISSNSALCGFPVKFTSIMSGSEKTSGLSVSSRGSEANDGTLDLEAGQKKERKGNRLLSRQSTFAYVLQDPGTACGGRQHRQRMQSQQSRMNTRR